LDIFSRSGDIRDQSLKWSKVTEILHVLAPNFLGEELPEFLEWDYKIRPDSDHVAKFQAIGRGTSENSWGKKKKTSAVKHKPVRNGGSGRPKKHL